MHPWSILSAYSVRFDLAASTLNRIRLYSLKLRAFQSLMNDLDEGHTTFFEANPLVFLNACETGTGGLGPFSGPSFPDTLLLMGARGVIATESPVWAYFA
jgi:hypothetical protein